MVCASQRNSIAVPAIIPSAHLWQIFGLTVVLACCFIFVVGLLIVECDIPAFAHLSMAAWSNRLHSISFSYSLKRASPSAAPLFARLTGNRARGGLRVRSAVPVRHMRCATPAATFYGAPAGTPARISPHRSVTEAPSRDAFRVRNEGLEMLEPVGIGAEAGSRAVSRATVCQKRRNLGRH